MNADFEGTFSALKSVFAKHLHHLSIKADTATEYTLHGKVPSPFPQHRGGTLFFGSVRLGKAYVAFHLMPLYMNDELIATISPELKKRMQGKTCFNFRSMPDPALLAELNTLTAAGYRAFREKKWI